MLEGEEEEGGDTMAEEGSVVGMAAGEDEEVLLEEEEEAPGGSVEEARAGKDTRFRGVPTGGWEKSFTPPAGVLEEVFSAEKEEDAGWLDEGALPVRMSTMF